MPVSKAGKVLYIFIPLIIYGCILFIGELIFMILWLLPRINLYVSAEAGTIDQVRVVEDLNQYAFSNALLMQTVLSVPVILVCLFLIRSDLPRRRFLFDRSQISVSAWIKLIPLAAVFALAGNFLFNIGDFTSQSEAFTNTSEILQAGTVLVQFIGIGFIIPICEELLIRGLVYMRMRQYLQVNMAIIFSALIFALLHGNMIQGIYAFVLGVILAWFYEKYGSLLAPVLMHITANLTAMGCVALINHFFPENGRDMILFVGGLVFSGIGVFLVVYLSCHVSAKRIYTDNV
jgi:membrane protease YdiL (CAAX protease family)